MILVVFVATLILSNAWTAFERADYLSVAERLVLLALFLRVVWLEHKYCSPAVNGKTDP